jgi:hypothetical protein
MDKLDLPVPVLDHPHWRVNIRPTSYEEELIPTLSKCFEAIEKNKLSLRGWDYPHLSRRDTERGHGPNWVASWSDFMNNYEYWRFYQSGQFLHLMSVREATESGWKEKLEADMRSHLSYMRELVWESVPGFIDIINFVYKVTEIYEFAARLCQSQIYTGRVSINIEIKGIRGFVLAAPWERAWHSYYAASEDVLSNSTEFETDNLVAASKENALKTVIWFFERFGWLNPSEHVIAHDQEKLLKGGY